MHFDTDCFVLIILSLVFLQNDSVNTRTCFDRQIRQVMIVDKICTCRTNPAVNGSNSMANA